MDFLRSFLVRSHSPANNSRTRQFLIGLTVFVLGYGVTYLYLYFLSSPTIRSRNLLPQITGWVYLSGHHVGINYYASDLSLFPVGAIPGYSIAAWVIPPCSLVVGGYVLARRTHLPADVPATIEGATVIIGYLPMAILSVFLLRYRSEDPPTFVPETALPTSAGPTPDIYQISPDAFGAIVMAGLVYPLIFGGLGGFLAFECKRQLETPTESSERAPQVLHHLAGWQWAVLAGGAMAAGVGLVTPLLSVVVDTLAAPRFFPPHDILVLPLVTFCLGTIGWYLLVEYRQRRNVATAILTAILTTALIHPLVWSGMHLFSGGLPTGETGFIPTIELSLLTVFFWGWPLAAIASGLAALVMTRRRRQLGDSAVVDKTAS